MKEILFLFAITLAIFLLGFKAGEKRTITMAAPITILAPHDTTSILIRFADDELHCFFVN